MARVSVGHDHGATVGIEERLSRIEAQAALGIETAVRAIRINLSGADPGHRNVPIMVGAVRARIELDHARRMRGGGIIEQQEVHPARLPRIHAEIYTIAENVGTQRKAPTGIRYRCGWTDSYGRALVRGFEFCDIRRPLFEACAQHRRRGTLAGGASNADVLLWHWHHG